VAQELTQLQCVAFRAHVKRSARLVDNQDALRRGICRGYARASQHQGQHAKRPERS